MFFESIKNGIWQDILNLVRTIRFVSVWEILSVVLDIAAVAVIIYYAIRLVRETRAMQLLKAVGVILAVYAISSLFSMSTLKFFVGKTLDYGLVVLIILFQPEIRRALEKLGRSKLTDFGKITFGAEGNELATRRTIDAICDSAEYLARRKEGALIVIERETRLGDITSTGTVVDAIPSAQLLDNIFFKNSPLHDGAVVISDNRIDAAGCVLPLSSTGMASELGTRHRAALGMSEVSDALTVVVSEERGSISVTLESKLQQNLSVQNLRSYLEAKLLPAEPLKKDRAFFRGRRHTDGK